MAGYWAAGEILSSSPNPFIFMMEDDDDDFYHYDSYDYFDDFHHYDSYDYFDDFDLRMTSMIEMT